MASVSTDPRSIAVRSVELMATGGRGDFAAVIHPDGFTHERRAAPPSARGSGPDAFYALACWLRGTFADLSYEIHCVVADGGVVTVNSTMSGRQTGEAVLYTERGTVDQLFAPTGREFAITQSHWFRMAGGTIVEHWANRDDLGMARQLGWLPPRPPYVLRCMIATRRARSQQAALSATGRSWRP